jgi:hypothetical protein
MEMNLVININIARHFIETGEFRAAKTIIKMISIFIEFETKIDIKEKVEMVEMLMLCGVESGVIEYMNDIKKKIELYIMTRELMRNRRCNLQL